MTGETLSYFAQVIKDHLELKERNSALEHMPIDRYKADDPFDNHPLFKTEQQGGLEEATGREPAFVAHQSLPWHGDETAENAVATTDVDDSESNSFWSVDRARDF